MQKLISKRKEMCNNNNNNNGSNNKETNIMFSFNESVAEDQGYCGYNMTSNSGVLSATKNNLTFTNMTNSNINISYADDDVDDINGEEKQGSRNYMSSGSCRGGYNNSSGGG